LPSGIPGIGEEMEGAIQHAPQPARQSISPGSGAGGQITGKRQQINVHLQTCFPISLGTQRSARHDLNSEFRSSLIIHRSSFSRLFLPHHFCVITLNSSCGSNM
jgi:hypothetical protein